MFSVDADTGNLTMNKVATAPDSYLLQVMVRLLTLQSRTQQSWFSKQQQMGWESMRLVTLPLLGGLSI